MKERTPESVSGPDDDYARRYGTQSVDDVQSTQDEASTPSAAPDPFDGFGDYANRHRANTSVKQSVYEGFRGYAARYARGRKATGEPLTAREQAGSVLFFVVTLAVFVAVFTLVRPYVLAQFRGALGMDGLIMLGLALIGSMIATALIMGIVAILLGRK